MKMTISMTRLATALLGILAFFNLQAQVPISQEGTVTLTCGGEALVLTDSDANAGNYAAGEIYTITVCPENGNYLEFNATPEAGGSFDLANGDFLNIYDGVDNTGPLLGAFGGDIDSGIGFAASSTFDNASGCLTFVFTSGASSPGAAGFAGVISCTTLPLPFTVSIAGNPADENGYIDICQGETVSFSAITDYPYSGQGYVQSDATCNFLWEFPDGTSYEGVGMNSIPAQTFNDPFGYLITVTVTDNAGGGIYSEGAEIKVRVSTTPDFSGIIAAYRDSICLGGNTTLIGGIPADTSTSFGVLATQGAFIGGGLFGDQLFLPDGTGQLDDIYQTTITIDDFEEGTTLQNADDIVAVCVTIEHTFLGDLEMWLECPDGTQVTIFDTHVNTDTVFNTSCGGNVGFLPGGWCPGGVNLGNANSGTDPGEGFQYCFTPNATNPSWGSDQPMANPVPAGDYQPEGDFADFIGCLANGDWTLNIADNWGGDDGWVFNWSILFNPTIDPNAEFYTPVLVEGWWEEEPTIISELSNDTIIVVEPTTLGEFFYTFNVIDNFGCAYDTTVALTVLPAVLPSVIEPACNLTVGFEVENQYAGGTWSYTSDFDSLFVFNYGPDAIDVSAPGDYVLSYYDNFCQTSHDFPLEFLPYPVALILPDTTELCSGQEEFLTLAGQINGLNVNYIWTWDSLGTQFLLGNDISQAVYFGGEYQVQIIDVICGNYAADEAYVLEEPCIIETYNVFTPNGDGENDFFHIQAIEKFRNPVVYVYNRWGNVVFEKSNYRNDWDMADLNEGTYFYVILNPDNNESFKGSFTLLR